MALERGYTCGEELCQTRLLLETALLELVIHELAADEREKTPHSLELQKAVDVLREHCGYSMGYWVSLVKSDAE